ncbi:MAG: hypothetical protein PHO56_02180 [Patescibacteria group bacterium]|nr:hypothetical protein [Patescibacteria group bacterium]
MRKILYESGQKFNRLTFIKELKEVKTKKTAYRMALWGCDCGKKVKLVLMNVVRGYTKSCGCFNRELTIARNKNSAIHGMTKTRFWKIWSGIIYRCDHDPKYIPRGVCERWRIFLNFKSDMYDSYIKHYEKFGKKDTSIDRIDNSLGYSKENCRWATLKEQLNNREITFMIEFRGKRENLEYWSKNTGIKKELIFKRIWEQKWPIKRALETPSLRPARPNIKIKLLSSNT